MQTGKVTAVREDTGTIQVTLDQNNRTIDGVIPQTIGHATGLQFMPTEGDVVLVDTEDNFVAFVVATTVPIPEYGTAQVKPSPGQPVLRSGELILISKYGQMIKLNAWGDIVLMPGPKGQIFLGSPSANELTGLPFTGVPVVRDGDTITGTTAGGVAVTGVVHASTTKVRSA